MVQKYISLAADFAE